MSENKFWRCKQCQTVGHTPGIETHTCQAKENQWNKQHNKQLKKSMKTDRIRQKYRRRPSKRSRSEQG